MPLPCCQVRGWGYHLECLEFESEECVLWMVFVVEWDAEESVWGFFDGEREVERLLQLVRRLEASKNERKYQEKLSKLQHANCDHIRKLTFLFEVNEHTKLKKIYEIFRIYNKRVQVERNSI